MGFTPKEWKGFFESSINQIRQGWYVHGSLRGWELTQCLCAS